MEHETPVTPATSATPAPVSDRRLLFHAVSSALYALLPVPLLDDSLIRRTRRKMVRELATARGLQLSNDQLLVLSGTVPRSGWGCLFALLVSIPIKIVYKLIRRVFRTIFIWLAINDAVNAASATFHDGYLLRAGLAQAPDDPARATQIVRRATNAVLEEVDPRPFQKVFKSVFRTSRGSLRAAARHLRGNSSEVTPPPEQVEEEVPPEVVDRLEHDLEQQRTYLQELEHRIERQVAALKGETGPPSPPESSATGT